MCRLQKQIGCSHRSLSNESPSVSCHFSHFRGGGGLGCLLERGLSLMLLYMYAPMYNQVCILVSRFEQLDGNRTH